MQIDNNPFCCNKKYVVPPFGPFAVLDRDAEADTENALDACITNTFGPYDKAFAHDKASSLANIEYEITMTVLRHLLWIIDKAFDAGDYWVRSDERREDLALRLCHVYLFRKSQGWIHESDVEEERRLERCKGLLRDAFGKGVDDFREAAKVLNDNVLQALETGGKFFEDYIGPFTKIPGEKGFKQGMLIGKLITTSLSLVLESIDRMKGYRNLDASRLWVGTMGRLVQKDCKYMSDLPGRGLYLCNFNVVGTYQNGFLPQCFLPVGLGSRPTGSILPDERVSVTGGLRIRFRGDPSTVLTRGDLDVFVSFVSRGLAVGHFPMAATVAPVTPTDAPTTTTVAPVTPTDAPVTTTDAPTTPAVAPDTTTDAQTTTTVAPVTTTDAPTTTTVARVTTTDAPTTSTAATAPHVTASCQTINAIEVTEILSTHVTCSCMVSTMIIGFPMQLVTGGDFIMSGTTCEGPWQLPSSYDEPIAGACHPMVI